MTTDRRRGIEWRADGSAWNHSTMRMWLEQLDLRAPKRATVERLSRKGDEG